MLKKNILKKIKYFLKFLPDETYLKLYYFSVFKKKLDLKNPTSFNEKIQWLKINDRNPEYIKLVDKYEVREYIEKTIGKKYLVPIIGVYDNFDDIDFEKLPSSFVIKCTHDSGGVVICKEKTNFDIKYAKRKINNCMKHNYFYIGREWPYKFVKPRIIIEEYLEDNIIDYKLMCFNGKVKGSIVCSERDFNGSVKVDTYDENWKKLPFSRKYPNSEKLIEKPQKYEEMVKIAEQLSQNMRFARIDLYEVKSKIYFGEITLYPGCGFEKFNPTEWDEKLGSWINLKD